MTVSASTGDSPVIESRRQLVEWFESGSTPKKDWAIGTEHEKFAYTRDDLRPIPYEGERSVKTLLTALAEHYDWEPIVENGNVIALTKDKCSVSLEPGGQIELSGAPLKNIHQTCGEVHTHLHEVREICDGIGIDMLGVGHNPKWKREDIPWMPKGRYGIMKNYMPKVGNLGLDMMLRTSTIQVNLDFSSEADMVKKFKTSLALQPVATALFAASPFVDGKPSGFLSARSNVWTDTDLIAAACCRLCSKTVLALNAMSTTCSMCRCISSIAMVSTLMQPESRSVISWMANSMSCRANVRP